MESIDDVGVYPIILDFLIFFALLFIWVLTAKKSYIEKG